MTVTTPAGVNAPLAWANIIARGPVDLRRLVTTFRRHWPIFLAVALTTFALIILYTWTRTPIYTAVSSVMLDTRQHNLMKETDVSGALPPDNSVVDSEVEILRSRALAERVVRALNLTADPEFNKGGQSSRGLFGGAFKPLSADDQRQRMLDATVDSVLDHLTVQRRNLTYVINISFDSVDAQKAARLANVYADKYLTAQLEAKFEATKRANGWLNERLGSLKGQVSGADQQVAQYQAHNGLLAAGGTQLTEQVVSQLQTQESTARAALAEAQARLNTARQSMASGGTGEDLGTSLASPVIIDLRAKLAEETRKQGELLNKYGPRHPSVLNSQNQAAQIQAQIKAEVGRQIGGLQTEVNAAQSRVAAIEGQLGGAQGQLARNKTSEVGLTELQRNADSLGTLYKNFLDRFEQTSAAQMQVSDSQLVSSAQAPLKPSSPNKKLNLALGVIFGLLFGGAAIVGLEMWSGEVRTSEDVERMLQLPSIGSVPTTRGATNQKPIQYLIDKPLSSFAESFRTLRASIQRADFDTPVRVLAITSALPGEGKSTTSFCLARSTALGGKKTIVLDCDLRRRSLHEFLASPAKYGLLEVLAGTATLEQALYLDEPSGCHVLPLAQSPFTPRDVFNTAAFDKLLARLRLEYDAVILDCAPVLAVADTKMIACKADTVLFLVQWQKTPVRAVKFAVQQLEAVGGKIAGIALTQVNVGAQAKYGYGDSGYYYKQYSKYYTE